MAFHYEKDTGDLVYDGWEKGIAPSPHSGVGNLQAVNISTEEGEVMCSYARTLQSQPGTSAASRTINFLDSSHLSTSFTLTNGVWINISASSISGLSTGNYYIQNSNGTSSGAASTFQISSYYNSAVLSGFGSSGTATFTLIRAMAQPLASATEPYSNGTQQYRYYILDSQGLVWVYDTAVATATLNWFLPDFALVSGATGIAVINGWLHIFESSLIFCKPTVNLADSTSTSTNWTIFAAGQMETSATHFAFSGRQGKLYYTDNNFIGSIFPDTSLLSGSTNIQSYASFTASSTTGTISQLISGSIPYNGTSNSVRIPAVFFHALTTGGANPAAVAIGTVFYIKYLPNSSGFTDTSTFEVYSAASGGSALDISSGSVGTQYFATYYPVSSGGVATITFTPQRLNLPFFETSTAIAEVGNIIIVGTKSNALYPWNQIGVLPDDIIFLPENDTSFLLTVNNMVYSFSGHKGNIYLTNGSAASAVISVPDYCAGIAGTQASYIEPYFTWGGPMYLRGRVYFSILDQTSTKAGNCGGIWSFVPTQNFFFGQDVGLALRLENQASYGTYSGVSTVLLASQTQTAVSPQYWNGWYSSISSPTYGIDFTSTTPSTTAVIETDLAPTGTYLKKKSFAQVEYKLAAPLASGEAVTMKYRLNGTDAFQTCNTAVVESATGLSGYFTVPFQNTQWLQLQATLIPITSSSSSFVRLKEIRVR